MKCNDNNQINYYLIGAGNVALDTFYLVVSEHFFHGFGQ